MCYECFVDFRNTLELKIFCLQGVMIMFSENPGTDKVEDLLKKIYDGSYVIPYFQRGFEWEPNMVSDLLESILRSYYTGIILFWDLDSKEAKDEVWDSI